jgi:hypothetical protein
VSKHTPGPWWTDAKYDGKEMGCSIIAARTDSGPLPGNPTRGQVAFATAILNTQARECEANAKLIAAAPELLKSCEALLEELRLIREKDGPFVYDTTCRILARAAIAKARGES